MKMLPYNWVLGVLLGLYSVSAQAITIDTFDGTTAQSITVSSGSDFNVFTHADGNALGGKRIIKVGPVSGGGSTEKVDVKANGSTYRVSIEQGPFVKGKVSFIWDGSSHTSFSDPVNYSGLGGFNLESESATKFILKNITYECASPHTCTISLTVYDASSPSGLIASTVTLLLSGPQLTPVDIAFNFSDFLTSPAVGATAISDLSNVGAIVLEINPGESSDLTFDSLLTDGVECQNQFPPVLVPSKTYVIDQCGVCNGDNTVCADCSGVPNGSNLPGVGCTTGTPGACSAGKYQPDCTCQSLTTASTEICDALDNDCNGLADENSICAQPLTKDNPCVKDIKGDYYSKIRKNSSIQHLTILDYATRLVGRPVYRNRALAILKKNDQLLAAAKKLVAKLPKKEIITNSACINIACASANYAKTLSSLSKNSNSWYNLTQQVIQLMKDSKLGGQCEGDSYYCRIRLQLRIQEYNRALKRMKDFLSTHKTFARKGPFNVNACVIK